MISNDREYRSFDIARTSEEVPFVEGYAAVFDSPTVMYRDDNGNEYKEVICRCAFESADMSDVVLNVDHTGTPIARTRNKSLSLSIDQRGLKIVADMSGCSESKEIHEKVKSGLLDKMSFAFTVSKDGEEYRNKTRYIKKIDRLFDVSIVTRPAYEQTSVIARSFYEGKAIEERKAFELECAKAKCRDLEARAHELVGDFDFRDYDYSPVTKCSETELDEIIRERRREICLIRDQLRKGIETPEMYMDIEKRFRDAENGLLNACAKMNEIRNNVDQAVIAQIEAQKAADDGSYTKGSNNSMENRSTFYNTIIEKRAAGSTSSMGNVIPQDIMNDYVTEKAPGAFLQDAKITYIQHNGDLDIPVAELQTVSSHTENEAIADSGYVPGKLHIAHAEYAYNTAYSDLGVSLATEDFKTIIESTVMESMLKKMDGICCDAVSALSYVDDTNAKKVTAAPGFTDFTAVASMLGENYVDGAKWYMNSATYFSWMVGLKDANDRPILDPSKAIAEQAPFGYHISIDANVPANVIYFGNGNRVHLNYARQPELNNWTDFDHNTEKVGVRCAAGAAAEAGSFVKLYK